MKIIVLSIEQVEPAVLEQVQENLTKIFLHVKFVTLKGFTTVPQEAYNSERKQYISSFLLSLLRDYLEKTDADKILGITTVDLYAPPLNFVFGEAELNGELAIISLCRFHQEFYGKPADQTLFLERTLKEATHEIGHTFGLTHCSDPFCVMFFSNSILDVDRKCPDFCQECLKRVHTLLSH
ncbi:MAG: archaemetzincin family Zn-dependent metalloprotease [Candidatus Bathyarchaeia archaeon]|jgi:archaemetzincin|nr:archaemetzincin family Zn-dependent metalloprotease [Candidatus Bathyarchaeota archaeon A05DMB-4]MDH7595308.1 archaemetzincin family Zn-dependent metalloprotease [Candidatus Bathyarchaeota archaeon]